MEMYKSKREVAFSRWVGSALVLAVLLLVQGCGSSPPAKVTSGVTATERDGAPPGSVDFNRIPDAVPRPEPLARWGNRPYTVFGVNYQVKNSSRGYSARGYASWYGTKFHGRTTSSGEVYDMYQMTAAHRSLPLPTYLEVTNLHNGRTVVVKVNDRGPFHGDRILDLSYAAAGKLGFVEQGVAPVAIRAIDTGPPPPRQATAPGGSYLLQIGAFSSRYSADRLRSDLARRLGYPTRIEPGGGSSRSLYRVQIGPLDYRQAEQATGRLAQLGFSDAQLLVH